MILNDLVKKYCPDLINSIKDDENQKEFVDFLKYILKAGPKESKMRILWGNSTPKKIRHHFPDNENVYGCNGTLQKEILDKVPDYIDPEDEVCYALDFTRWEEWLGMSIDDSFLEKFPEYEVLIKCLNEMTQLGFCWKEVQKEIDTIHERLNSCVSVSGKDIDSIFREIKESTNSGV